MGVRGRMEGGWEEGKTRRRNGRDEEMAKEGEERKRKEESRKEGVEEKAEE